jgi:hypothetical protein
MHETPRIEYFLTIPGTFPADSHHIAIDKNCQPGAKWRLYQEVIVSA